MKLLYPNTDNYTDYIEKGKLVMTWRTTLFLMVVFFCLCVVSIFYDTFASFIYLMTFLIMFGCLVYLRATGRFKLLLYIYVFVGLFLISITSNIPTGLTHAPDFAWGISVVILAFTTLGPRIGWISTFIFGGISAVHFTVFYNLLEKELHQCTFIELVGLSAEVLLALSFSAYYLSEHLRFTRYTEGQMSLANAELELQNQIIQRKSDENAILVKEIHHRVKNNLQIIISLLRMHREEVSSPEAQKDFDEAINRILSMALLHQQMYREKELSRFNLEEYVSILVQDIVASYKTNAQEIDTEIKVQNVVLKLESIVPLGLLINELVSNSLKHAFPEGRKGCLKLSIKRKENGFTLTYEDDGIWVDNSSEITGFGSELVEMLAEQLNGKLTRSGSTYMLDVTNA